MWKSEYIKKYVIQKHFIYKKNKKKSKQNKGKYIKLLQILT